MQSVSARAHGVQSSGGPVGVQLAPQPRTKRWVSLSEALGALALCLIAERSGRMASEAL